MALRKGVGGEGGEAWDSSEGRGTKDCSFVQGGVALRKGVGEEERLGLLGEGASARPGCSLKRDCRVVKVGEGRGTSLRPGCSLKGDCLHLGSLKRGEGCGTSLGGQGVC